MSDTELIEKLIREPVPPANLYDLIRAFGTLRVEVQALRQKVRKLERAIETSRRFEDVPI